MSTQNVEMDPSEVPMTHAETQPEDQGSRIRTLTDKGKSQYEEKRKLFLRSVESSSFMLEESLRCDFNVLPDSMSRLSFCESNLRATYERYSLSANEYMDFLSRTRTVESNVELDSFWKKFSETKSKVLDLFDLIERKKRKLHDFESRSHADAKSECGTSNYSDLDSKASSLAARKRAKAEAAKAKLQFAEQRARLKTELDIVNQRAEVAAADAEANYLERQSLSPTHSVALPKDVLTPFDKTMRFLDDVSLNANAAEFIPATVAPATNTVNMDSQKSQDNSIHSDLSRYLLKKELILHKFRNFDDKPEHFVAWKGEFKSIIQDLQCSAVEELGLLTSHLGPESSRQATDIRTSCANNPTMCLEKIWTRLHERFGSAELVEAALKTKLQSFPKIIDMKKLYNLHDILTEIESAKCQPQYRDIFAYFDSSVGLKPIVQKLPHTLQEKWITRASNYKTARNVLFPLFTEFVKFIAEMSRVRNDPGLVFDYTPRSFGRKETASVSVKKSSVDDDGQQTARFQDSNTHTCVIHGDSKHPTSKCREFRRRPIEERRALLRKANLCLRCCDSSSHFRRKCKANIQCSECKSKLHCAALHEGNDPDDKKPVRNQGEEKPGPQIVDLVSTKCTEVCGEFNGKSCAKILPVKVYPQGRCNSAIIIYAILDDQSNRTLAKAELFDELRVGSTYREYSMNTCSGRTICYGRTTNDLVVESLRGNTHMNLPCVLECENIPENYSEIPTPEVASHYTHLKDLTSEIQPIDTSVKILLLIGRDITDAHIVMEQCTGPPNTPFAQRLPLGWTIIGEACLSRQHIQSSASVCKTLVSKGSSLFEPCESFIEIKQNTINSCDTDLFQCTPNDNKPGLSIDDCKFLDIMQKELTLDDNGKWLAPLPFRVPREPLPNNYSQALRRARSLEASLRKDPKKREHLMTFMQKLLDKGHAELAPPLTHNKERWYLPLFRVYHPHKPDQIRGVFDSSAKHEGISLNDVLLQGPDLANNLLGVLLRFRREMVAIAADIQHMFHCFVVCEHDRNFLRFLWYKDNNLDNGLTEFRMTVHVFGNRPSPSIANYGLLKIANLAEQSHGKEVKDFITNNFYVDDGLTSCSSSVDAISLLKRTQDALKTHGGLRLHKFASNDENVMRAFDPDDLAKDLIDFDFDKDVPLQRSLGLVWNLKTDTFQFNLASDPKPHTRRGVLSTINSLYDPLGFIAPIVISGKIILRKVVASTKNWDDPLPPDLSNEWNNWKLSLSALENLRIPRAVLPYLSKATRKELWIYSDASELAISAVAYLRVLYEDGTSSTGFLLGKSKVAPTSGHSIPRLELCAAVLAADLSQIVLDHIQITIDDVKYFTDSRVVLGYICNDKKRFFIYVANRVAHIRNVSKPSQWNYVSTNLNPADIGTRGIPATGLESSLWIQGPIGSLQTPESSEITGSDLPQQDHPLISPEEDKEVRCNATDIECEPKQPNTLGTDRFSRFSSWRSLVEAVALLQRLCTKRHTEHLETDIRIKTIASYESAECFIIKCVQGELYSREISCLRSSKPLPKDSAIASLDPKLNSDGLLLVGGRLNRMKEDPSFKNPIIIPGKHHIANLLIRKCHDDVRHQGRHFTEGKIRSSGFWITGCKRLVSSLIHKCFTCRLLRGKLHIQKMSDLPEDRLTPGQPPFTSVGIDIFGPWDVLTRRMRGGSANSKRWAALFTCMATRAVHIEVIEEMSTSSFINALRRFIAIRGSVKTIRSDRGTNFIGAVAPLQIDAINVKDGPVRDFLYNNGTTWIFNSPHSSHMGGVWERMIRTTRRILDSMLLEYGSRTLTHEVLTTFLAEVTSIINSRPLLPVSSDEQSPFILTPAMLLNQKTDTDQSWLELSDCDPKELLLKQWKRVQNLSSIFWKRWKTEYIQTLQPRRKWLHSKRDLREGDIVLLREKDASRNNWPMGIVLRTLPSQDGLIRKAEIRVIKGTKATTYIRPVTELVVLLEQ